MKKVILLLLLILSSKLSSQWTYYELNDPFLGKVLVASAKGYGGDFPYQTPTFSIYYVVNRNEVEMGISGIGYTGCDDNSFDISYDNNPNNVVSYDGVSNKDKDGLFFWENKFEELFENLKKYSIITVRFANDCSVNRFTFRMSGSSSAINKLQEKTKNYSKKAIAEKELRRLKTKEAKEKYFVKRDSVKNIVLSRLKDSMIKLDISKKNMQTLEKYLVPKLDGLYIVNDRLNNIRTLVIKPHTEKTLSERGKFQAYIKFRNDKESIIDNDFSFTTMQDELKFERRKNSFLEDINYIKLLENERYDINIRISFESERIYSSEIFDTIIAKIPFGIDKKMEFEVGGRVKLLFANSDNLSQTRSMLGNWQVSKESPLLKSVNYEFELLEPLIKNILNGHNRLDIYNLKRYIKRDGLNINDILNLSFYKKRGKLSKYQYDNGLRVIQVNLINKKSILLSSIYVDTKKNKFILVPY